MLSLLPCGCHVWMSLFSVLFHPPTLTDLDPQLQEQVVRWGAEQACPGSRGVGVQGKRHTGISFTTTSTTKSRVGLLRGN